MLQVIWYGMYFTDCVVKVFLSNIFLKPSVCIRCNLRRDVLFKLIFIWYNMEPLGFLVFFLILRTRVMRRQWRRRRTRDLLLRLFLLCFLLLFFLRLRGKRTRKAEDVRRHFLFFCFLWDLPLFEIGLRWITFCSF